MMVPTMTAMMSFFTPPIGNWRRAGIAAAFERDAIIHRPRQDRSKKDDPAEIAIGAQMRERPGLHAGQHRVLEHALDVAGDISRSHHDACRPHQRLDDVARPWRRIPDRDESGGAIRGEAVADQHDSDDRYEREQTPIRALPDLADKRGALVAHRHEHMRAKKNQRAREFRRSAPLSTNKTLEFLIRLFVGAAVRPLVAAGS